MRNALTGEAITLVFDLIEDGQFVSADLNSASYTIRTMSGQGISGHVNAPITTIEGQTTVLLPIPAEVNTNAGDFELRHVELAFTTDGRPHRVRQTYRIHNWLPFSASVDSVRSFIGLSASELRDHEVDLVSAYLQLKEELTDFDTSLMNSDLSSLRANEAIVCQAVLDLTQSLPFRALQSQGSETAQAARFSKLEWNQIEHRASSKLAELKRRLSNSLEVTTPLFTIVTGTDPITGA